MEEKQKENQLLFLRLSIQYLHFVETVIEELLKQGNLRVVLADRDITLEEYNEATKWSDRNIAEPLFYNLYHGIELLLKGYLIETQERHNMKNLFDEFKKNIKNRLVIETLQKYIGSNEELIEPLKSFFLNNGIDVDEYNHALRYPLTFNRKKTFYHYELKRIENENISFYQELKNDINNLLLEVTRYGTDILVSDY